MLLQQEVQVRFDVFLLGQLALKTPLFSVHGIPDTSHGLLDDRVRSTE